MNAPEYFIEMIKKDGVTKVSSPNHMHLFGWNENVNRRLDIETIAIFKIYPKRRPVVAHYDYDIKATILE